MPNRILRDWTDSERVNALSANAERFFIRLIMKADDYGRYYGSPQLLKSYLFPLTDARVADISRWIAECVKSGLIVDYTAAGKRVLEILNFGQRLRVKLPSKFPPRDGHPTDTRPTRDGHMTVTCPLETETETETETKTHTNTSAIIPDVEPAADASDDVGGVLESCKVFSGFPKTSADVLTVAERSGIVCTEEMAESYLLNRNSTGWIKSGGRPVRNVAADLKGYCMTWRQNRADDAKRATGGAVDVDRAGREARKKRREELEKAAEEWS